MALPWTIPVLTGILLLIGTEAAVAQTQTQRKPLPSPPPDYCKQFSLTGPKFLELIQTVIDHGDLTDVPFIEKALGTKLDMSYPIIGGQPYTINPDYRSNEVLGNPISTWLSVNKSKALQSEGNMIAFVEFTDHPENKSYPTFIEDCLQIPAAHFSAYFGGHFAVQYDVRGGGGNQDTNYGFKGKHKSEIYLTYSFTLNHEFVAGVAIKERPVPAVSK